MEKLNILVFRSSLSVPIMDNNLISPFIMREAGLVFKDTETIHSMDPYLENHSIYFTNVDIYITFFLHGVFSYLSVSKLSLATLEGTNEIYLMTTEGRWNS